MSRLRSSNHCSVCGAVGFTAQSHPQHGAIAAPPPEPSAPLFADVPEDERRLQFRDSDAKRRRRGRGSPRSKTLALKGITREMLRAGRLLYPPVDIERPRTRGDCVGEARPCPWVACKHHLYLDINPETGSIKINFPDLEPWELKHTCSLDVAERGGLTLEEVGEITNLTRERIRQVEVRGLLKIKYGARLGDSR